MEATPSATSDAPEWEPPDWLLPEAVTRASEWWQLIENAKAWPETFRDAYVHGYCAGYERGQRRRRPDEEVET